MFLTAILAVEAILHWTIVGRYGLRGNAPPLVFGLLYAALAAASVTGAGFVPWAALVVAVVGTLGLVANYRKIAHPKGTEHATLALNALLILLLLAAIFRL